tara:strand:- start:4195 stop:5805 length:1611 start_codon:yes stop_codon:yes gene_type:complete
MGGIISAGDIGSRLPGSERRGLLGNIFMGMGREADQLRTQDAALGALTRGGSRMPIEAQERLLASAFPKEYFLQQLGGIPARRQNEALQSYLDNPEGQQALARGAIQTEKAFNKKYDPRSVQQNMPDLPTPDPIPLGMGPPPMLGGMERPMDLPSVLPMDDVSRSIFTPGQRQEIEDYGVKKQGITEQADLARQAQADLRQGIPGFERERVKAALTPLQKAESPTGKAITDYDQMAIRLMEQGLSPTQIVERIGSRPQFGSVNPQTSIAKINADFSAGNITKEQQEALIRKALPGRATKTPEMTGVQSKNGQISYYNINEEPGATALINALNMPGALLLKDRPPVKNYTQSNLDSAAYFNRMLGANSIFDQMEEAGYDPRDRVGRLVDPLPGGYAASSDYRQYNAAKSDWISAKLREESGAAIGPDEYEKDEKAFFPQPGDSLEVLEQKRKMRERVQKGMLASSQGAYKDLYGEPDPEETIYREEVGVEGTVKYDPNRYTYLGNTIGEVPGVEAGLLIFYDTKTGDNILGRDMPEN